MFLVFCKIFYIFLIYLVGAYMLFAISTLFVNIILWKGKNKTKEGGDG
jgi:hypothetical protein